MKNIQMSPDSLRVPLLLSEISIKDLYVWFIQQQTSGTPISAPPPPQMICNSVVSQLNVVFLIQSVLFFINIHTVKTRN